MEVKHVFLIFFPDLWKRMKSFQLNWTESYHFYRLKAEHIIYRTISSLIAWHSSKIGTQWKAQKR
jgi:hypothetical protein